MKKRNHILVPISLGEVADKLSILHVKSKKIKNKEALKNIEKELIELSEVCIDYGVDFGEYIDELIDVNDKLWDILQLQRDKESRSELDEEFIRLSLDVYRLNDKRFSIKQQINADLGSSLVEEKYYDGGMTK